MILIVGLGNPGRKFQKTRHNLGFRVVKEFGKKNNFPDFKLSKKLKSEISEGFFNNEKIILAKPQTFMNLSGKAVYLLVKNFLSKKLINSAMTELLSRKLWVIHDDIDLPLGQIRISVGRGAGGHKGVESVIRELKTKDFVRFRIGINQFAQNQKSKIKNQKVDEFVLKKFNRGEEKIIKKVIKKTVEVIEFALRQGIEKAQSTYNICARLWNE